MTAIDALQRQFASRVLALEPRSVVQSVTDTFLLREVDMIEADGSPSPADYPILSALIPDVGADVGAVGTALRTEFDAKAAALADLESVRRGGATAINAAADSAAVDAALGAVIWP